jgi:hypothetical protein
MKASEAKALSDYINNLTNNNQLKRTLVAIETATKKGIMLSRQDIMNLTKRL